MAVAFDAAGTSTAFSNLTAFDYTGVTVGTGTNRALLIYIQFSSSVSGITAHWDSAGTNQSMTQLQTIGYGGASTFFNYSFYLLSPTSGNKNLHVAWTTTSSSQCNAFAVSGADQTGGTTTFYNQHTDNNAGVGVSSFSQSFVVNSGDLGVVYDGNSNGASSVNQTQWLLDANGYMGNYALGTGASITFTHNFGGIAGFSMLGCAIKAAAAGDTFANEMQRLMMSAAPIIVSGQLFRDNGRKIVPVRRKLIRPAELYHGGRI